MHLIGSINNMSSYNGMHGKTIYNMKTIVYFKTLSEMNRTGAFAFIEQLANECNSDSSDESDESTSDDSVSDAVVSDYESAEDETEGEDIELVNDVPYISKNGNMEWTPNPPNVAGRRNAANIIRNDNHGPAPHVNPQDLVGSLSYFFTDDMIGKIVEHTNQEAARKIQSGKVPPDQSRLWFDICDYELKAFLGILIIIGVLRGGQQRLADFWNGLFGQNCVIATMSRNRFSSILQFLRFDDRLTRPQRHVNNKLAPISELWHFFTRNCRRCIIPSSYICVDEQIVPTRGRCPFRVYMAKKPHK